MKDIVVIAPFSSMSDTARLVVSENGYSSVDILEGNLGEGVRRPGWQSTRAQRFSFHAGEPTN